MAEEIRKIIVNIKEISSTDIKFTATVALQYTDGHTLQEDTSQYTFNVTAQPLVKTSPAVANSIETKSFSPNIMLSGLVSTCAYKLTVTAINKNTAVTVASPGIIVTTSAKEADTSQKVANTSKNVALRRVNRAYLRQKDKYKSVFIYNNIRED